MSEPIAALRVDFGEVGFISDKQRFYVTLDSSSLSKLISDASNAYRIYELFLISRPGDIWNYIYVVAESTPRWVSQRLTFSKSKANQQRSITYWDKERVVPFIEFDDLFYWDEDGHIPGNDAWMEKRHSEEFQSFARQCYNEVLDAQKSLEFGDELIKHVVNQVKESRHAFDYLDRDSAVVKSRGFDKLSDHQAAYYKILEQLLRDENIASVACRGGDYQTIRLMAVEQRRRANQTGRKPRDALKLSALVNIHVQ
jgi:hypothetical protein